MVQTLYTSGKYLEENPMWHADESPWKVAGILHLLKKHNLQPQTICEAGCGSGEILHLLQKTLSRNCEFWGYDISPQAMEICRPKENRQLHFTQADITTGLSDQQFDLILMMDVLEHLEDYFSFLHNLQSKSEYKIIQLPMDISLLSVLCASFGEFHKSYGHLHYFTKETALQMVQDAGYTVLDYYYNGPCEITPVDWKEAKGKPWLLPKKLLIWLKRTLQLKTYDLIAAINRDFAVRLNGRQRILILAQ